MLQPNQPMGQPNMAATGPQTPKPSMPAGQMLSGVAGGGLGSILDNVARPYAGNPEALKQKGDSGDLLAALASQRLLAQKEHALEQLKLQAKQQNPMAKTVVQQNEDKLLDLTKQEMQAEQADTLQQKQGQMQDAQKQLMQQAVQQQAVQQQQPQQQGIGGIPAPNAAEPQAMASGGIVAFAGGGGTTTIDPVTGEPYTEEPRIGIADWLRGTSASARGFSPEASEAIKVNPDVQAYVDKYGQQLLSSPDLPAFQRDPRGYVQQKQAEAARPLNAAQGQPVQDTDTKPQIQAQVQPQNAADLRKPAPIRNAGGIPGGGGRPESRNGILDKELIEAMKQNPQQAGISSRDEAYKFLQPSEEDMAARRKGLSSLQALNEAENSPDRQWIRRVMRTLPSHGTSFAANTMGEMGANAVRARDEEYAGILSGIDNEQKMLKGIMEDVYKPKKEATDVGSKSEQFASTEKTHAMSSAAQIKNAEMQAAVSAANNAAMAAERALTRETNDQRYWGQTYKDSLAGMETAIGKIDKIYADQVKAMPVIDKPTPEQKAQMLRLDHDRQQSILALQKTYNPLIMQAAQKAGIGKLGELGAKSVGAFTLESVTK